MSLGQGCASIVRVCACVGVGVRVCVLARACAREMARMLICDGVRPMVQQQVLQQVSKCCNKSPSSSPSIPTSPAPPPAGAPSVAKSCDSRKGLHCGRAIMCLLARQLYYGTLLWDTLSVGGTRTWEVRERGFRV